MSNSKVSIIHKFFSLLSVIRGYNLLVLIVAQYLAAIFIFSPEKSLRFVLLDMHLHYIVLATVCVVSGGYIINNFYDTKLDKINRPIKASIDGFIKQETKLSLYFFLNFTGFLFGVFVSTRAALFFSAYIFGIWFYSHKLKRYPFTGSISAAVLSILPFFAIFVHFRNFSKIIFVHAAFLFLVLLVRELIKDLEAIKGAIANNYITFPVAYGEKNTKLLCIFLLVLTTFPVGFLLTYSALGYMQYYFYLAMMVLIFIGVYLWKSQTKKQYILLHNILKILLLIGIVSMLFIDPSLLLEKVIDKLQ